MCSYRNSCFFFKLKEKEKSLVEVLTLRMQDKKEITAVVKKI